jgi:hypothetical protein
LHSPSKMESEVFFSDAPYLTFPCFRWSSDCFWWKSSTNPEKHVTYSYLVLIIQKSDERECKITRRRVTEFVISQVSISISLVEAWQTVVIHACIAITFDMNVTKAWSDCRMTNVCPRPLLYLQREFPPWAIRGWFISSGRRPPEKSFPREFRIRCLLVTVGSIVG